MKLLFLLLATGTMLAACSAPKYTNSFHRYSTRSETNLTKTGAPIEIQEETMLTSASKETLVQPGVRIALAENSKPSLPKITKADRKGLRSVVKEFRAMKKKSNESVKDGDKSKNDSAVAGFILAFSPLVGALIAAFLSPGTGVGIVIGAFGFILAIVFCSIGLKSEKRRLAKAGFTIMIIETILLVLGILAAISIIKGIN